MSRRAARITHDEVARMVKAVQSCGLSVGRVIFDGDSVSLVIGGDIGEKPVEVSGQVGKVVALLREPKL